MPKFIYINNKVVKFIDQFTWYKLTNGPSNFHNFLHVLKFVMEKESSISGAGKREGAGDGAVPRGSERSSAPCPAQRVQMGLWQSYSCSPNCPLSVLLILWFRVHVFQAELSCEVADTFLPEWQSCLKPKNVGCHFQSRRPLSKEKARLKELCERERLGFEFLNFERQSIKAAAARKVGIAR